MSGLFSYKVGRLVMEAEVQSKGKNGKSLQVLLKIR